MSFASGLRARLISRKISWWLSRRACSPDASRLVSTPVIKLLNSARRSWCSRQLRSMHFVADRLRLRAWDPFIRRFHSGSGDWW